MGQTLTADWPSRYEFRIKGHLGDRPSPWFTNLAVMELSNGETRLVGLMEDQAALYGLLSRMRDLGVLLLSVNRIPEAGEGGYGAGIEQSR